MSATFRRLLAAVTTLVVSAHVWAGDGRQASVDSQAWEGLKARLAIGTASATRADLGSNDSELQRVNSLSLMGDYYLSRPWLGTSGGWRATSGVLLGSRSSVWSSPSLLDRRATNADSGTEGLDTLPYLGLGYTGWSSKGWGLSADVGLMGSPRSATRLGKSGMGGAQSLDDSVRDLRFAPLVQLGLSYSF